jgi:hypothetical protein
MGPAAVRNECALLVNAFDPKHIVGIGETAGPRGLPAIAARVSFDGGASWRESWPPPVESGWAALCGPVLAMDARSTLHLAAAALCRDQSWALAAYRSVDGGLHWSAPAVVVRTPEECCYSMAADLHPDSPFRGNVYLAADAGDRLHFACLREESSGTGCSVTALPYPCRSPVVLVDPRGTVCLVWMAGAKGWNIVSACSTDGGHSFSAPVTVAGGISGVQQGLPETVPAACLSPGGVALCAWADDREGRSRIYCRRSTDSGRTWQGPPAGAPLVRDSAHGQHEFQPQLLVTPRGEICCAFYEYRPRAARGEPMVDLMMAVSYDGGATFQARMVLSEQPWDPSLDVLPGAACGMLCGMAMS